MVDLAIVGGGLGGLATAVLAARGGLRVALIEAHTRLGGCAGWFDRGPYAFDAGATALMGLGPDEPLGMLVRAAGLEFEGAVTPAYRVYLPDRTLDVTADRSAFEAASAAAFPGRGGPCGRFWRLQEWVGSKLFAVAARVPRLPARSAGDLLYDLRILGASGLLAASSWALTVDQVLGLLGLGGDRPFRALIAMLLQDTAQAGPDVVPFANAAACLHAYRLGMARPRGGMKALAEGLGHRFAAIGGDLRTGTIVDRVEPAGDGEEAGFVVTTRRREAIRARQVVFNLPIDRAAALLGRPLAGRLARRDRGAKAAWGAFTAYLAFRRDAVDDDGPLFHHVLQDYGRPVHDGNNALISLSPPGDPGYGPADVRIATMSTHTRPGDWFGLPKADYEARKTDYAGRMLAALRRALPGAADALLHSEFATPRSFLRYTRRAEGRVGGPPVSRRNSNFLAVGPDVLGRGLWVVGDSVFPGQGTMAVVLSAARVVERITGRPFAALARPLVVGGPAPAGHLVAADRA